MAYLQNHRPGEKDAPRILQTSANDWRMLAAGLVDAHPTSPGGRFGYDDAIVLPVFNRFKRLGDDSDPFSIFDNTFQTAAATAGSADTAATTPIEDSIFTQEAAQGGAYTNYFPSVLDSANALVPGSVAYNAVVSAGPAATTPGTPAYNALLSAGLSAAQIAKAVVTPTQNVIKPPTTAAAAAPVVSAGIIPGLSNSTLLIVGVIGLMFLASGKKR